MCHRLVRQHTYTMQGIIMCILHSSIASLLSCSPSSHPACIHILCRMSIISMQNHVPSAGSTAYLHYARYHNVYPSFIYCITAKLQPIHPPCLHTCTMQHINYISANLWATGWSDSIPTLFKVSYSVSFIHLL